MEPKVTMMVLKVDLHCSCCYKKVKRLLCKYPQIRDQLFDEKTNTVTIKVVCCSPEKIRDKLCSKGGKSIKSIEIKEPPKPPQPQPKKADDKSKPAAPEADKPKAAPPQEKQPKQTPDAAKPKSDATPAPGEKAPETAKKNGSKDGSKPAAEAAAKPASEAAAKPAGEPASKPATEPAPAPKTTPEPPKQMQYHGIPMPVQGYPPVYPIPVCCGQCYHGQPGGPCYQGYGGMPPPQPGCDPYAYGGAAYRTGYYPSRCDYFSEENPAACAIM